MMKTLTRPEEQILLTIYHLQDKAYLVNIRDRLKEMTGKYLDVGTIYVPLKRLDHHGYLETHLGEPSAEMRRHPVDHGRGDQGLANRGFLAPAGSVLKQVPDRHR